MRDSKPHWLTPAGKTKVPRVVLSFDTETVETPGDGELVMRLRCWDAILRTRHPESSRGDDVSHWFGETTPELLAVVQFAATLDTEAWIIAHNVSFDLAVTSLPFALVASGWELDGFHLGDDSTWWSLKRDGHTIVITDSWSWLRCSLGEAAKDINKRKVALPDADDSLAAWHQRCRKDAEILDLVMKLVMDWWRDNGLGSFGITGASCGWRALRAHIRSKAILVGPDGDRTAFERRAVFGGLKEVYGVGRFIDPWISDYDFADAYPVTVAGCPMPLAPAKKWTSAERLLDAPPPAGRDFIAEVEITTHVPCAPLRVDGEVWSPVGTFRTVLAGPEARYAATVADSVTVIHWQAYRTGFELADWAAWVLTLIHAPADEVPPIIARIAKTWGRNVTGRFATHTSRVITTRPSTHPGWHLETGHDIDTGRDLEFVSIGGVETVIAKDLDGSEVFPAVLAFIEAHVRVALRQMMATRDPSTVLQCNTDGWWEMRTARINGDTVADVPYPYRVVRKAIERSLVVRGPNHVLTPHERRFSGVPRTALDKGGERFLWHDWPGLRWQLEHGELGQYKRPERDTVLAEHYVHRWVLETGETIPITVTMDQRRQPVIVPWSSTWGRRADDNLAPYQIPTLTKVLESDAGTVQSVIESLPDQPGRGFAKLPQGGQRTKRTTYVPAVTLP